MCRLHCPYESLTFNSKVYESVVICAFCIGRLNHNSFNMPTTATSGAMQACIQAYLKKKAALDVKAETGPSGYVEDFALLRQKTLQYREERTFDYAEGEKPYNYRKNRYKDILPYDYTRVKLNRVNDMPGTDYINANYIKGPGDRVSYIAAQGPLQNTVRDFWRMLWEQKTKVIIMACSEFEGIPPKHKCERYWPITLEEELTFDQISVMLEKEIPSDFPDYKIRYLRVHCGREVHRLHQLHYVGWPDHGVPDDVTTVLDLINTSRGYQTDDYTPIVVHCSAGCGRTGTIMAFDYVYSLLKAGKICSDFDLFHIIDVMRTQRPSLVQSLDQYKFVFEMVAELFERHLDLAKKHAYENVKLSNAQVNSVSSNESAFEEDSSPRPVSMTEPAMSEKNKLPLKPPRNDSSSKPPPPAKPTRPPLSPAGSFDINSLKPTRPPLSPAGSFDINSLKPALRESCMPTDPVSKMAAFYEVNSPPAPKIANKPRSPAKPQRMPVKNTEDSLSFSFVTSTIPRSGGKTPLKTSPRQGRGALSATFDSYSLVSTIPESSESVDLQNLKPPLIPVPSDSAKITKKAAFGVVSKTEDRRNVTFDSYSMVTDLPGNDNREDDSDDEDDDDDDDDVMNDDAPVEPPDQYAYANPLAVDKWSMQHYAIGRPNKAKAMPNMNQVIARDLSDGAYMDVDFSPSTGRPMLPPPSSLDNSNQYADVVIDRHSYEEDDDQDSVHSGDSNGDAPAIPQKSYELAKELSISPPSPVDKTPAPPPSTGTIKVKKRTDIFKLTNIFKSKPITVPYDGSTPVVKNKGQIISFGHRVGRPKGPSSKMHNSTEI